MIMSVPGIEMMAFVALLAFFRCMIFGSGLRSEYLMHSYLFSNVIRITVICYHYGLK